MKEFNLEEAKAGARVCTRDGRSARIIGWNREGERPIIARIQYPGGKELEFYYRNDGTDPSQWCDGDLMMVDETEHVAYTGIFDNGDGTRNIGHLFMTFEDADRLESTKSRITIGKVFWKE